MGISNSELLEAVGGEDAKAVQEGGASGQCVSFEHFDRKLTFEDVSTGGSIIVFGPRRDMLSVARNFLEFFIDESCGQCTPCREGTTWLDMILRRMLDGGGRSVDLDLLYDVSDNITVGVGWPPKQTTICPLGPSAVSAVTSLLAYSRAAAEAHIAKANRVPLTIKGSGA